MKHSILSASGSHRWLKCPGSARVNYSRSASSSKNSGPALLGITAHALLEVCLRLKEQPEKFFGQVLQKGLLEIDEDMVDAVGYALDYIYAYMANHPSAKLLVEHRVCYGPDIGAGIDEGFGTGDVLLDDWPRELVALDYKHGIGVSVSVKDNPQLMLYLLGHRLHRGRYRRYRSVVVQPRLRGRKPVQEAPVMLDAALDKFAASVRKVVPLALAKDGPRLAGSHCRFCAANGNCQEQYKLVIAAAKKEFS